MNLLRDLKGIEYIGDSVYVGSDEYHVWLFTYNGIEITNKIALDPYVLQLFNTWIKKNSL